MYILQYKYAYLPSFHVETFREGLMTLEKTRGHKRNSKCYNSCNFLLVKKRKCVANHCSKIFTNHKYLTKNAKIIQNGGSIVDQISK
ncbi:hypothetical protein HanXRQr2_Chr04g0186731 [Helianthus annuus]|uniref:Uncharacterized protein n=1 Tax=Helianthus annuus TaxID=4232 RepID=A0A9K3JAV2_HELAN|nr:hypothetical protein HanXRQr2_Chr04g0186731 [Helianthus annuus]